MSARKLGEGSWIADDYTLDERTTNGSFMVWCAINDGHVLRYLDRSYQLRIR